MFACILYAQNAKYIFPCVGSVCASVNMLILSLVSSFQLTTLLGGRDLIVVGAGVIGMEYACMINVVPGTTVTVIDPRPDVLSFADNDVIENLQYTMRQNGAS